MKKVLRFCRREKLLCISAALALASMFAGVQLAGVVGLFGFPIGLSLLKHLNNTGTIDIFKRPD